MLTLMHVDATFACTDSYCKVAPHIMGAREQQAKAQDAVQHKQGTWVVYIAHCSELQLLRDVCICISA
jgi:hypothetical protein